MKVVDIHPEELIDKLTDGSLTIAERERLDVHLAQCSSCRFELSVRADLVADAPVFEERPQLTVTGGARSGRALTSPRELPLPPISRSLRPRSRSRWPLALLAAALVLCAGGAMAAVISGAVRGHWPRWSADPKPAESSQPVSDAKPTLKSKRASVEPAPARTSASEPSASSAASVASALPAPTVADRTTLAPVRPRRAEAARAAADDARSAGVEASVATRSVDAANNRAPVATTPAAALFADANRARRDGNADRAVGLYRALQNRYPSSSEAELSRALLAQLLLDRGNPEAALAGFDRYLLADAPVLSAEALVGRARALEQLGKPTQAAAAWRLVQSRFPGSVHARLAASRLASLGMR